VTPSDHTAQMSTDRHLRRSATADGGFVVEGVPLVGDVDAVMEREHKTATSAGTAGPIRDATALRLLRLVLARRLSASVVTAWSQNPYQRL
jgi:hypothetical protein